MDGLSERSDLSLQRIDVALMKVDLVLIRPERLSVRHRLCILECLLGSIERGLFGFEFSLENVSSGVITGALGAGADTWE